MPLRKPMETQATKKEKKSRKLWMLEKRGVPLGGTDGKGGLRSSTSAPYYAAQGAAGACGRRSRGDQRQRRCLEWYIHVKVLAHKLLHFLRVLLVGLSVSICWSSVFCSNAHIYKLSRHFFSWCSICWAFGVPSVGVDGLS